MKKIFLFAVIAVVGASFTSCKKDYTCTCTTKMTGSADIVTTVTLKNVTKSDAKKACDNSATVGSVGGSITMTCAL